MKCVQKLLIIEDFFYYKVLAYFKTEAWSKVSKSQVIQFLIKK